MLCTVEELRGICLWPTGTQEYPTEDCDEVYPNILLGNSASAADLESLKRLDVGHVLNAAHGHDASLNMLEIHPAATYADAGMSFLGIPAIDMMSYSRDSHFDEAVSFIRQGVESGRKVLVHCKQGISRSAALVIAYLVREVGMELQEATRTVRRRREILPNDGFLLQLCRFYEEIQKRGS